LKQVAGCELSFIFIRCLKTNQTQSVLGWLLCYCALSFLFAGAIIVDLGFLVKRELQNWL